LKLIELFENRIGRFFLNNDNLLTKEELKSIFTKVVVVECSLYQHKNSIQNWVYGYYAYSDLFDKIKAGDIIPEYQIISHSEVINETIIYSVKFERMKQCQDYC